MQSNDIDGDIGPSRDREHSCLTDFISNDERGVFGAVLWNTGYLVQSTIVGDNSEIYVIITYGRKHSQGLI